MKGSQVAVLAIGWLAVAVASAVIGSASVARVGLGVVQPQSQITVSRPESPLRAFPTDSTAADFVGPDVAPARAEGRTVSVAPYPKSSTRTTVSPLATAAPTSAALASDQPAVLPPSSGSGSAPTLGLAPTASPTSTSPGKGSSKKGSNGRTTSTPVPSVLLATWASADGGSGGA